MDTHVTQQKTSTYTAGAPNLKRKAVHSHLNSRPSNKEPNRIPDQGPKIDIIGAELALNSDGYYQVHIDFDNCTTLAHGCGLKNSDVDTTVAEENNHLQ